MAMNKVTADIFRNVLKVGGAVLATSGLLPAQCSITDPTLASTAGAFSVVIGTVWGIISAKGAQNLHDAVEAAPNLPPAKVVEKVGPDAT